MSNFSHRQPVWTWSSVVLLSTLLLSPVAVSVVLQALAESASGVAQTGPANGERAGSHTPAPGETHPNRHSGTGPRRSLEEENQQSIAPADDTDTPEWGSTTLDETAVVFLLPTRTLIRIADSSLVATFRRTASRKPRRAVTTPFPPRAPPA